MICPKCQHESDQNETEISPLDSCPACHIVYLKYLKHQALHKSIRESAPIQGNGFFKKLFIDIKKLKIKQLVITIICIILLTSPKLFSVALFLAIFYLLLIKLLKKPDTATTNRTLATAKISPISPKPKYNQKFKRPVKNRYEITYKDSESNITKRIIKSCWRVNDNGYIYVMAFCELRDEPRTFYEKRIKFPMKNLLTGKHVNNTEELPYIEIQEGPRGKKYFTDEKGKIREFNNTQFY